SRGPGCPSRDLPDGSTWEPNRATRGWTCPRATAAPPKMTPPEVAASVRSPRVVAISPRLIRLGTSSISHTVTIASRHLANWSPGSPLPTAANKPEAPAPQRAVAEVEIRGQPPRWAAAGFGESPDTVDTMATKTRKTRV